MRRDISIPLTDAVRGANVTKGYLANPEANKSAFTQDGWFRTGDRGKLDSEGCACEMRPAESDARQTSSSPVASRSLSTVPGQSTSCHEPLTRQ